uniref:Uncharacterized protein n=1 Tax=Ditylenchus dipsaci TaxID=166011 RepID=A0A915DCP7_9BILA
MSFFIQSLGICVVLEIEGLTYDALHYIEIQGQLSILPNFFQMWMTVVSCTVHSVIILIFNNTIRRAAKEVLLHFCCENRILS